MFKKLQIIILFCFCLIRQLKDQFWDTLSIRYLLDVESEYCILNTEFGTWNWNLEKEVQAQEKQVRNICKQFEARDYDQ